MSKLVKYSHLYQTKQAHDADYSRSSANYLEPWVAYVASMDEVTYNLPHDYSFDYLTFTALESGTFTLTIPSGIDTSYLESVSYSTDGGQNWTTTQNGATNITVTTPTINAGEKVLWKGIGVSMATSNRVTSQFSSTGNYKVSGNVMSLLYGDNFSSASSFSVGSTHNFTYLFGDSIYLVMASDLILPATTLASSCYRGMFQGCTSLASAPALPATTLANYCYREMFNGCTSLVSAPALPATTLATYCYTLMFNGCTSLASAPALPATTLTNSCYYFMFSGCTSLASAPALPATTLAGNCYQHMFFSCTSLVSAPALPATTLVSGCYSSMFYGCSSLNYIKAMFTTTPSNTYTSDWVNGVAATGTFVKNSAATWNVTGTNGVPTGWTVETASE